MTCTVHPEKGAVGVCNHCGKGVCAECAVEMKGEKYCKECIAVKADVTTKKEHSPGLAAAMSVFIPGFGQMYNGQIGKGIVIFLNPFIVAAAAIPLGFLLRRFGTPAIVSVIVVAVLEIIGVFIFGIRDAYTTAQKIKEGRIPVKNMTGCLIAFVIGMVVMFFGMILLGMLAAIAIPNLLMARVTANELAAEATVKRISTEIEVYRMGHDGNYPSNEAALSSNNPSSSSISYNNKTVNGYTFSEFFEPDGYKIVAVPSECQTTGRKIFTVLSGGNISVSECKAKN